MKLAVITDEISQDLKKAIELSKKYNLQGIELRSVYEKNVHELDMKTVKEIKAMADTNRLEICAISAPFFKCNIDSDKEYLEHLEILKKSIEYGQIMGAGIIRGFSFWKTGAFEDYYERIIEKFQKAIEIVKKENVILALESDPSVFATNGKKLNRLVKGLNCSNIKVLWDPGNDIFDPDGEIPYPDGYKEVRDEVVHVHLKDAVIKDGHPVSVPIGKGAVQYVQQLQHLVKDGYDGYMVLETHYRPRYELSEELLAKPKGSQFSYLGDIATEESLINLHKLLAASIS